MQVRVVEDGRSRMTNFRLAPARPRQSVVISTYFRIVGRRTERHDVELGLIAHMRFQALRRLAAIPGGPTSAIYLAEDVFCRRYIVLDTDVLEHLVGKAEFPGEKVGSFVVRLGLERRRDDLFAPLQ